MHFKTMFTFHTKSYITFFLKRWGLWRVPSEKVCRRISFKSRKFIPCIQGMSFPPHCCFRECTYTTSYCTYAHPLPRFQLLRLYLTPWKRSQNATKWPTFPSLWVYDSEPSNVHDIWPLTPLDKGIISRLGKGVWQRGPKELQSWGIKKSRKARGFMNSPNYSTMGLIRRGVKRECG